MVVVPCYNEQEAIPITANKLISLLDDLTSRHVISSDSGMILVDDGHRSSCHYGSSAAAFSSAYVLSENI